MFVCLFVGVKCSNPLSIDPEHQSWMFLIIWSVSHSVALKNMNTLPNGRRITGVYTHTHTHSSTVNTLQCQHTVMAHTYTHTRKQAPRRDSNPPRVSFLSVCSGGVAWTVFRERQRSAWLLFTSSALLQISLGKRKSLRSSDFELAQCVLVLGAMVTEWSGKCCVLWDASVCVGVGEVAALILEMA